jgi:hypothetical protein
MTRTERRPNILLMMGDDHRYDLLSQLWDAEVETPLRISKSGDTEQEDSAKETEGLAGFINVAARLGDAHGDEALALKTLESGIKRFPDAPAIERAKAYLYRAELAIRTKNIELAQSSFDVAKSLKLSKDEKASIVDELDHVEGLLNQE